MRALRGVSVAFARGRVHAILGENGAGKSTLLRVSGGALRPDAGELRLDGVPHRLRSPRDARAAGIGMVHQHPTSIPAFTVAENVALAAGSAAGPEGRRRLVRAIVERTGLALEPDRLAGELPIALKQRLEIVKALATDARLLLLDEPTAVLAPAEAEELLATIRRFAVAGGAAVLVTHKLDEALRAADTITVLRDGLAVWSGPAAGQSADSLARAMIGSEESERPGPSDVPPAGPPLITASRLIIPATRAGGPGVRDATFEVRGGEIVGIAAVEGNGQRELLRAIARLVDSHGGHSTVEGPIAFIPEDRTTEGLIPELTLAENIVLGASRGTPGVGAHSIAWPAVSAFAAGLLERFGVRATGPGALAGELSGGNQQKLVVARELTRGPRVIVAENPTRGLDVRAGAQVHEALRDAARGGAAVLVHSSDLDEVLALAHRVLVMSRGRLLVPAAGAARDAIGRLMVRGDSA